MRMRRGIAMSRALSLVTLLVLSACDSSDEETPITCAAFEKCDGEGGISINALRCPDRIDDPACGRPYRAWLRCYTDSCPVREEDAGSARCPAELQAWYDCRLTRSDAAAK